MAFSVGISQYPVQLLAHCWSAAVNMAVNESWTDYRGQEWKQGDHLKVTEVAQENAEGRCAKSGKREK